ncbi:hypothetical protein ACIO8F_11095 [Streptomyces sp. NPDC087228]|uniref:hypothetical protein n=1 Tax=unclassified Streptomyces TaxID=2593676 RepID=UPI00381D7F1B
MRTYASVLVGNLVFATLCCFPGPFALLLGCVAWREGEDWAWIALVGGVVCSAAIPVMAVTTARREFPRITRRDRVTDTRVSYGDDSFVVWAPRSERGPAEARLVRADVLEASFVRYHPDGEATFTTYYGNYTPDEFTPLIRMRLRVHDVEEAEEADGADGAAGFEITDEWRVPSLCLSAVTAGRLVVLVAPAAPAGPGNPEVPGKVTPQWPRSALLAGTRTCRVIGLDGRTTDVTRRCGRQLRQMRISREVGGVEMVGDTIDLRRLDRHTAARYTVLADRDRALPEDRAPVTEPGEEARWIVDHLPGEPGGFGSVGRGWSRRGGHLVRARLLEMRGTNTFQDHGPVLDTVLRIHPADATLPFDAARRLTVPMNYLTVLHRTREVVLSVSPSGRSYVIDWARTNLLAGVTAATVIAPDGQELPVTGCPDVIWSLMNLLASHALSNPAPVLDLRKRRMSAVAGTLMEVVRGREAEANPVGPNT